MGNLLILEMGAWKMFPPLQGMGEEGEKLALPTPLPAPKKISGIGVLLSHM